MRVFYFLVWFVLAASALAQKPIQNAHAHNDYAHRQPLNSALANGFTSIEIDVFLHKGALVVSHLPLFLNRKPSLSALYLTPIEQLLKEQNGFLYQDSTPVILMLDFKTGGATYDSLKSVLAPFQEHLSVYYHGKRIKKGAIEILISGHKPFNQVLQEDTSWVTIDGGIGDLDATERLPIVSRVSGRWRSYFNWKGRGDIPANDLMLLRSLIQKAHENGKDIRFYGIPDKPKVWQLLLDEGIDWVNTDKLTEFHDFSNLSRSTKK